MKGKKVLSVLLASVMMFTAVPVGSIGAMAAPVQNAQVQGAESEDTGREWSFQYRSRL
ncbi:MAG: hypothetical protein ACLTTO_10660 [Lachnospiraceae bacterium]